MNFRDYLHQLVLGGGSEVAARAARVLLDHPPLAATSRSALAIRWAVDHVQEHPAEGVRASGILMDRVLPKPGATQAVYVSIGGNAPGDGTVTRSPAEIIRARLLEISQAHEARQQREREERAWDSEIVEAEIVTEDEHEHKIAEARAILAAGVPAAVAQLAATGKTPVVRSQRRRQLRLEVPSECPDRR